MKHIKQHEIWLPLRVGFLTAKMPRSPRGLGAHRAAYCAESRESEVECRLSKQVEEGKVDHARTNENRKLKML